MDDFETNRYSEEESVAEFDRLFPHGFSGPDVLRELAPDGWERSPLVAVFHPSPQQVYEESARMHRNVQGLLKPNDKGPPPPEPPSEEEVRNYRPGPFEPDREVRELVGMCLWDIFSDNHEVVGPDDRVLDLGSFRASGGFLADYLNRQTGHDEYDYIDFFMGTIYVSQRADLTPVYTMVFRRLRQRGLDWVYHFPKLQLVDFRPLRDALKSQEEPDWLNYSPSEAFAKEEQEKTRDREIAEMSESLEEAHREAIEEALRQPPPTTVQTYQLVYGRWPKGWPPRG